MAHQPRNRNIQLPTKIPQRSTQVDQPARLAQHEILWITWLFWKCTMHESCRSPKQNQTESGGGYYMIFFTLCSTTGAKSHGQNDMDWLHIEKTEIHRWDSITWFTSVGSAVRSSNFQQNPVGKKGNCTSPTHSSSLNTMPSENSNGSTSNGSRLGSDSVRLSNSASFIWTSCERRFSSDGFANEFNSINGKDLPEKWKQ